MASFIKTRSQLRLAWASLKSAPGFVSAVVATLALTLATLFVVLSLVNSYFLKPLDVFDESRMVVVEQRTTFQDNDAPGFQSYQSIVHWFKHNLSFDHVVMINADEMVFKNIAGEPKENILYVSGDYFKVLNTPFILGQAFSGGETLEEINDSVVISEQFWRKHLKSDPEVVGKSLQTLGSISYTISGVVSEDFSPPFMIKTGLVDVWLPTSSDRRYFHNKEWQSPWTNTFKNLKLIGVLKAGVTQIQAEQDLKVQIDSIKAQWLNNGGISDVNPMVTGYRDVELGNNDQLSLMMLAGALGLLLIAVLNVSTLFFSRALAQHKTLALQAVLGAKRSTLFNAILLQALLLMAMSFSVALFASAWGIKLFKMLAQGRLPLVNSLSLDFNLVLVAMLICIVLAYLFAGITAKLVNYQALSGQLQSSGKGSVSQVSGRTVRVLIGAQVFVATLLVSFSIMVVSKSLDTMSRHLGSNTENLYFVQLFQEGDEATLPERFEKNLQYQSVLQNSKGIKQVAMGQSPITARQNANTITDLEGKSTIFFPSQWVGSDYFALVGTEIIAGRTFSQQALRGEVDELMVSVSVAKWLQPDADISELLGKTYLGFDDKPYEIVGITEDFNHPKYFTKDQGRHIWWPARPYSATFVIEVEPGFKLDGETVLANLSTVNSHLTLWQFSDLQQEYDGLLYMSRLTVVLCSALALFTLLLAAIGIFGVLSYNLGLRRYEFGIRMALGAKKARLFKLINKEALLPVSIGFCLAVSITLLSSALLPTLFTDWLLFDAILQIVALLFTALVAIIACFRPLYILLKTKPMAALRNE
ncbi:ABC transporter permease [Pseudoalteromonas tunicata]|uniref:ABC transporter permease n=1 Tax=Pseudoalteromonas tunicata TaxID=314281 RepID=UPI00273E8AC1|nr:ABC transporter permease [Pseudoalteromonas tunicata]MDP4983935.1 ABC transporter permease [Pseudoalteromonas tunicata]